VSRGDEALRLAIRQAAREGGTVAPLMARRVAERYGMVETCEWCLKGNPVGAPCTCARACLADTVAKGAGFANYVQGRHVMIDALERAIANRKHPRSSMAWANATAEVEGARVPWDPVRAGWSSRSLASWLVHELEQAATQGAWSSATLAKSVWTVCLAADKPEEYERCDARPQDLGCMLDEGHEGECELG
jgi:hypothetical protein